MKKLFLLVVLPLLVYGQVNNSVKFSPELNDWMSNPGNAGSVKVWVDFTDKGENLRMLLDPESFLSKRSIQRRSLRGDAINETDLPLSSGYLNDLTESGVRIISKSKWFNSVTVNADKSTLQKLVQKSFVKKISLVAKGKSVSSLSNDGILTQASTVKSESINSLDYGESLAQLAPQQIPMAHTMGFDGSGVFICLMDAGFNNLAHEVYDSLRIVSTWDFVNNDPDVGDGGMGNGSHGTATLSVIGGYKPGKLIGTAYRANYLLAKTENTDTETPAEEDFWIAAAEWADSIGVDVTSTSLVYLEFDPPFTSYTWQDMDGNTARITKGADLAVKKGIVVFNSAGNSGFHATQNTLAAPADGDSVITIGSINADGSRSGFSSVGLTVDGRIKPDLMAVGSAVYSAAPGGRTNYSYTSGTSLACPIAAGVAALLLQKNPNLTPIQIREILRNTASQSTAPDRLMGWGVMNAVAALNNVPSGIETGEITLPEGMVLLGNYPNPFNPTTTVYFTLSGEKYISLKLYTSTGELVKTVAEGTYSAGTSKIMLDAAGLSSGNYFLLLNDGTKIYTQKLSTLK
ncbi:hypothetical protein MASR1M107_22270 [Ignavibacteriales bacterium]